MKYMGKRIVSMLCAAVMLLSTVAIPNINAQEAEAAKSGDQLTVTGPTGIVYPYQDCVKTYLTTENADMMSHYVTGSTETGDASIKPVSITWNDEDDSAVTKYVVEYGTRADYSNAITVVKDTDLSQKSIDVYNLYKGTTYYVRVTAYAADTVIGQAESTFQTTDLGPRIMNIDGLYNVRDLGGYKTADGKTTLQGLIFRGSEMDGGNGIELTEAGNAYMSNVLGIKTDMDLRGNGSKSPISSATKASFAIGAYMDAFGQKDLYRKIFSTLANENNYPVYIHCMGGADRTGTVCYLINALLGVSEEDLIRDYEMTSYSIFGVRTKDYAEYWFPEFVEEFKTYQGETLAEKAENYLLSIGLTETEIFNIRAIMLGEKTKTVVSPQKELKTYYNTQFVVSVSGNKTIASVTIGGTEVAFTVTEDGFVVAVADMPQNLEKGIVQGAVTFTDGETADFQFQYDDTNPAEELEAVWEKHGYANYIPDTKFWDGTGTLVTDEEAYTKKAIHTTVKDLTGAGKLVIKRYCASADPKYYQLVELNVDDLKLNQGYHTYKVSLDVPAEDMGTGGYIFFFDDNWELVHSAMGTVIGNFAGKRLDVYFSMKITGTPEAATVYLDRMAVVDPCENYPNAEGTACTKCGNAIDVEIESEPTEPEPTEPENNTSYYQELEGLWSNHGYANYIPGTFRADSGTVVEDQEAYTKKAIHSTVKDLTGAGKLKIYRYNANSTQNYYEIASFDYTELKLNQGYQYYKISLDVPADVNSSGGYLYFFDDNWELIHDAMGTVIGSFSGKRVDIYLSMKITGEATAATVYIDRLAVVDPCDNYLSEDGTSCTKCGKEFGSEGSEPEESGLAAELAAVPTEHSVVIDADKFTTGGKVAKDTDAYNGKAYRKSGADLVNAGIYIFEAGGNSLVVGTITADQVIMNAGYQLYKLTLIPSGEYTGLPLRLFSDWTIASTDLCKEVYARAGKTVDVYLSMKAEGTVTNANCFIDRVVVVDHCKDYMNADGTACTLCGKALEDEPTEPEAAVIATFTAEQFTRPYGDPIVTDAAAAQGKAAYYSYADRLTTGDAGLYNAMIRGGDQILGMYTNAVVPVGEITIAQLQENAAGGQYVTYKFTNADLSGANFIYLFDCWGFQVPLTKYKDALNGQLVDVYLSMKVTGDVTSKEGNTPAYYIDKVVIAEAGSEVTPDPQPTDPQPTEPTEPTEPINPEDIHYIFTADNIERPYAPGSGDAVVEDATSAYGKAVVYSYEKRVSTGDQGLINSMLRVGEQKLGLYMYGGAPAQSNLVGEITIGQLKANAQGGEYVVYTFKNLDLIPTSHSYFLYMFDCWGLKVNLSKEQQNALRTSYVDVSISLKVTGDVTDKNNPPTYYIDMIEFKASESGGAIHRHEYGQWMTDDLYHSATCTICNETLQELHTWDDGVVTKEPTDDVKGERLYTCAVCQGTKTEEFDKNLRYVFTADSFERPYAPGSGDSIVADPDSSVGKAVMYSYEKRLATGDKGLADSMLRAGDQRLGMYTYGGKPAEPRLIGELAIANLQENAKGGKYVTYKFKNVKVVPTSDNYFIYMFDCWGFKINFSAEQKAALQGQRVDVFLSMKVTGDVTSKTNPPAYYIDKVIIQATSSEGDNLIPYVPKAETPEAVTPQGAPTELPAEYTANQFALPYAALNNGDAVVEDATSAYGKAAMLSYEKRSKFGDEGMVNAMIRVGDQKLAMYTDTAVLVGELTIAELQANAAGGQYVVYEFRNVNLTGAKFMYLFDCWGFQVPLTGLADQLAGKQVDVKVSLKVTGDVTSKEGNTPAYYIDNVTITEAVPVEAHEHNYESWITDVLNHTSTCTVCGMKLDGPHSWDAGVVTKEATETEDGEMVYTCKVCQTKETKKIRKQSSSADANNNVSEPQQENSNPMLWVALGLAVVAVVIVVVLILAKKPGKKE